MDVVACCHGEPVLQGADVLWPQQTPPSCHVVLLYLEPGLCSANKDAFVCVCVCPCVVLLFLFTCCRTPHLPASNVGKKKGEVNSDRRRGTRVGDGA